MSATTSPPANQPVSTAPPSLSPMEDSKWCDGNFTVVSSDIMTFKVNDYVLFAVR